MNPLVLAPVLVPLVAAALAFRGITIEMVPEGEVVPEVDSGTRA